MKKHSALIKKLKKGNAKAQKELYETFAPRFMTVCLRYLKDRAWAEDTLIESFMKIYSEIHKYRDMGSFEAWMYRITVNQCLMELRKNKIFNMVFNPNLHDQEYSIDALDQLYEEDILKCIEQLPMGCRTVFNLFVIEGYSHKEIAYKLGVSEGTSKSQLNLAKKKLREILPTELKWNSNEIQ